MSVMISEKTWSGVTAAIENWRRDYDTVYRRVFKTEPKPPGNEHPVYRDLYAASESLRHPPRELTSREREVQEGARQMYATGPSYQRVMAEMRKGNLRAAAHFIGLDLNTENTGFPVTVNQDSLRLNDQGVAYIATSERPPMPQTPEEAMAFFMTHGEVTPGDATAKLAVILDAISLKRSVLVAANAGHFPQANQAALLLAKHYGHEPEDVNPYPNNSRSPWVDALPVNDPRSSGEIVGNGGFHSPRERARAATVEG